MQRILSIGFRNFMESMIFMGSPFAVWDFPAQKKRSLQSLQ